MPEKRNGIDHAGRPFLQKAHNGYDGQQNPVYFETRFTFDMRGKHRKITNPLEQEIVMHYDLRPTEEPDEMPVRIDHPDSGLKRILYNVSGEPIRQWDSLNRTYTYIYDELYRPKGVKIEDSSSNEYRWSFFVYGDDAGLSTPESDNLRGEMIRKFDQSGVVEIDKYDFKGNPLEQKHRLASNYQGITDWAATAGQSGLSNIDNEADNELESEVFSTSQAYDALNRVTESTKPDGSKTIQSFDDGGALQKVELDHAHSTQEEYLEDIKYNARGQKTKVYLGNNSLKNFTYDEKTFRINRILTTRNSGQDILQDLNYTYDPVGNIVEVKDDAQQTFYFNNSVVSPDAKYYYDPTYRLTKAKGREAANNGQPSDGDIPAFIGFPYNNSSAEVENYTQQYEYDEGGNILKMIHQANSGNWTRGYHYNTGMNNHLIKTSAPGDDPDDHNTYSHHYTHDARGNMTSMPHLTVIKRNLKDEIGEVDLGGGGTVYYQYDESGQRVRKVWDTGSKKRHRIYIGDYEVWREYDGGTLDNERETIHINGEEKRFSLVETQTVENGNSVTQVNIRYQYGNQVESACLELDESASIITYEEYHPFGTSSIRMGSTQSEVDRKRYRYNGKERDEETGLYYYGARYYAGWLGRFLRVDPEWKSSVRLTAYHYVSNNPVNRVDPFGMSDEEENSSSQITTPIEESQNDFYRKFGREVDPEAIKDVGEGGQSESSSNFFSFFSLPALVVTGGPGGGSELASRKIEPDDDVFVIDYEDLKFLLDRMGVKGGKSGKNIEDVIEAISTLFASGELEGKKVTKEDLENFDIDDEDFEAFEEMVQDISEELYDEHIEGLSYQLQSGEIGIEDVTIDEFLDVLEHQEGKTFNVNIGDKDLSLFLNTDKSKEVRFRYENTRKYGPGETVSFTNYPDTGKTREDFQQSFEQYFKKEIK